MTISGTEIGWNSAISIQASPTRTVFGRQPDSISCARADGLAGPEPLTSSRLVASR